MKSLYSTFFFLFLSLPFLLAHPLQDFPVDPRGGRPISKGDNVEKIRNFIAPEVAIPLFSGPVVNVPETIEVFYDAALLDASTAVVSLYYGDEYVGNCSVSTEDVHYEYFRASLNGECAFGNPGDYQFVIEIQNKLTKKLQKYEIDVQLIEKSIKPWPLENEKGVWPPSLPNLAGNLVHNYQSFSGASSAYWHEGVDIRSNLESGNVAGPVHSPVDGIIVKWVQYSSSALYWSLMVQEDRGFVWQFHHLDPNTVTLRVGDKVTQGQILGNIIFWPSSHNGALYHHTHMNVAWPHPSWTSFPNPYVDGWQYFNSIKLMESGGFTGGIKPSSDGIMYFFNNSGSTAFASSADSNTPVLSGKIDIVLNLYSEFEETNNVPGHPYMNGLYEVGYFVEPLDEIEQNYEIPRGVIPPLPLIRVDKTPNQWSFCAPDFDTADSDTMLRRVYKQSFSYNGKSFSSVFTYTQRTMYYIVTNTLRGEPDETGGFWDTAQTLPSGVSRFPNGRYSVTVYAIDEYGNRLDVTREVQIRN